MPGSPIRTRPGIARSGTRGLAPLLRSRPIDAIGNLSLAGAPLIGHVRALRSSPGLQQALLRTLMLRGAAMRVTVNDHRKSLLVDRDDPDRHRSFENLDPGKYHR